MLGQGRLDPYLGPYRCRLMGLMRLMDVRRVRRQLQLRLPSISQIVIPVISATASSQDGKVEPRSHVRADASGTRTTVPGFVRCST